MLIGRNTNVSTGNEDNRKTRWKWNGIVQHPHGQRVHSVRDIQDIEIQDEARDKGEIGDAEGNDDRHGNSLQRFHKSTRHNSNQIGTCGWKKKRKKKRKEGEVLCFCCSVSCKTKAWNGWILSDRTGEIGEKRVQDPRDWKNDSWRWDGGKKTKWRAIKLHLHLPWLTWSSEKPLSSKQKP